jgi:microcystin-dependent protein
MEAFLAMIMLWPCNFAPNGWAFCAGQLLSIAQNTALFSLLGTTYGGNGTTTFALPDLRGRVPLGVGQGPGLSNYDLGEVAGTENVTLLITQMPQHLHAISLSVSISASNAKATTSAPSAGSSLAAVYDVSNDSPIAGYNTTAPNTTLNVGSTGVSGNTGLTGGNQPFSIMQPFLGLNYCIAMVGIFPSRG